MASGLLSSRLVERRITDRIRVKICEEDENGSENEIFEWKWPPVKIMQCCKKTETVFSSQSLIQFRIPYQQYLFECLR